MKRLFHRLRRPQWDIALLLLTLVLSPLLVFPDQESIVFCLAIPVAWLISSRASGYFLPTTPLNLPLAILGAGVFINVFITPDVRLSLDKMAGTIFGLLFFFALTGFLSNQRRIRWASILFGWGGGLFAALTLFLTDWKPLGSIGWIARSLFPPRVAVPGFDEGFNPNPVGGSLALFLPPLLILSVRALRPFQEGPSTQKASVLRLLHISLVLVTLVLFLTQSRGAWIATLVALLFLTLARSADEGSHPFLHLFLKILFFLPALGGICLAYLLTLAGASVSVSGLIDRGAIWARAFWAIQDFPVSGMGLNMFRVVSTAVYPFTSSGGTVDIASAHNVFLQTALDLGLPLTAAYTAVWFGLFKMLYEVVRNSRVPNFRNLSVGLAGGLLAYCTFQIADAVPLGAKLGVFWWGAAALIAAMYRSLDSETPRKTAPNAIILLFWGATATASIYLAPDLPLAAMLLIVGSGALIGIALVPPHRLQTGQLAGRLARFLTVTSRPKTLALVFSWGFLLLLSRNAFQANRLFLQSIRQPEKMTEGVAGSGLPAGQSAIAMLRATGNAHWQLGNNRRAAELFQLSLSRGDDRPLTLLKCVIAKVQTRDFSGAEDVMRKYGLPSTLLAEFASTAGLSHDRATALLCADFFLSLGQPDPLALCAAINQYSAIGSSAKIAPFVVDQVDKIDLARPIPFDCSYDLGVFALGQKRPDIAHRLLDATLLAGPEHLSLPVRAKGCYVSYRFKTFYKASGQPPPLDYPSLGHRWCQQIDAWYSERMLEDGPAVAPQSTILPDAESLKTSSPEPEGAHVSPVPGREAGAPNLRISRQDPSELVLNHGNTSCKALDTRGVSLSDE